MGYGPLRSYSKTGGGPVGLHAATYVGTTTTGSQTLNYDGHPGYDYGVPGGTTLVAVAAGKVVAVDRTGATSAGLFIKIRHAEGYQSYSGASLVARYAPVRPVTLSNGVMLDVSGTAGSQRLYKFHIPARASGAAVVVYDSYNSDHVIKIYGRLGAAPTTTTYDYQSQLLTQQLPTIAYHGGEDLYILLVGQTDYNGYVLVVSQ